MKPEQMPGYDKLPEEVRRQIEDGISTWEIDANDPDGPIIAFDSIPWDTIAAMTPEQRDYYGLTDFYDFVMNLPLEHRPQGA